MTSAESPYGPGAAVPTPPSTVPRRRGRGIAALVLSLIPIALTIVFAVIATVAGFTDDTGWAVLGWAILGAYVVIPVGVVLGGTALGLGISAAVKDTGRGPGIAGAILGGLTLLCLLLVFGNFAFAAF